MALKYLSKLVFFTGQVANEFSQLISVDDLVGRRRCPWCYYYREWSDKLDYLDCVKKRHCLGRNLLYAILNFDAEFTGLYEGDPLHPRLTKKVTFEHAPRYVQLQVPSQLDFQCATTCHFFADRMAKKLTTAACSTSRGCGRDGSWWALGQLVHQELFHLPDYSVILDDPAHQMTVFGTDVDLGSSVAVETTSGYITIRSSDNHVYRLVNWLYVSSRCNLVLRGSDMNDPTSWSFSEHLNVDSTVQYLIINNYSSFIYQLLRDQGMQASQF